VPCADFVSFFTLATLERLHLSRASTYDHLFSSLNSKAMFSLAEKLERENDQQAIDLLSNLSHVVEDMFRFHRLYKAQSKYDLTLGDGYE